MGTASVIHQTAIHRVDANTAFASVLSPSGWYKNRVAINREGPKKSPVFWVFIGYSFGEAEVWSLTINQRLSNFRQFKVKYPRASPMVRNNSNLPIN